MLYKKGALKSCPKFTGKHLWQSLFFNKVAELRFETLLNLETLAQNFSCEFCEIFKNVFCADHMCATAFDTCHGRKYLDLLLYWKKKCSKFGKYFCCWKWFLHFQSRLLFTRCHFVRQTGFAVFQRSFLVKTPVTFSFGFSKQRDAMVSLFCLQYFIG